VHGASWLGVQGVPGHAHPAHLASHTSRTSPTYTGAYWSPGVLLEPCAHGADVPGRHRQHALGRCVRVAPQQTRAPRLHLLQRPSLPSRLQGLQRAWAGTLAAGRVTAGRRRACTGRATGNSDEHLMQGARPRYTAWLCALLGKPTLHCSHCSPVRLARRRRSLLRDALPSALLPILRRLRVHLCAAHTRRRRAAQPADARQHALPRRGVVGGLLQQPSTGVAGSPCTSDLQINRSWRTQQRAQAAPAHRRPPTHLPPPRRPQGLRQPRPHAVPPAVTPHRRRCALLHRHGHRWSAA